MIIEVIKIGFFNTLKKFFILNVLALDKKTEHIIEIENKLKELEAKWKDEYLPRFMAEIKTPEHHFKDILESSKISNKVLVDYKALHKNIVKLTDRIYSAEKLIILLLKKSNKLATYNDLLSIRMLLAKVEISETDILWLLSQELKSFEKKVDKTSSYDKIVIMRIRHVLEKTKDKRADKIFHDDLKLMNERMYFFNHLHLECDALKRRLDNAAVDLSKLYELERRGIKQMVEEK